MNDLGHQSVFFEAQKNGWLNPRSTDKRKPSKPQTSAFEFLNAGELTATPVAVTYLVDGIMEIESLFLLFAAPSAGKSFVAISMAVAIASGLYWLGHKTTQGPVFYLAGEGHAGLRRRLKACELCIGKSLAGTPLFVSKTAAALMDEKSAQAVIDSIQALCAEHGQPRLIVIDTFARNMGDGDENSNADVGAFINRIDNMRSKLGCAVLLVHHTGHAASDRARGASALNAAMDTVFRLDNKEGAITMIHLKAKESELNAPIFLMLQQVQLTGWLDANGDEMNSAVIGLGTPPAGGTIAPLTKQHKQSLDLFRETAIQHGQLSLDGKLVGLHVDAWRDAYYRQSTAVKMDTKKTAFLRLREKLVALGRLTVHGEIFCFAGPEGLVENYNLAIAVKARGDSGTRHTTGT